MLLEEGTATVVTWSVAVTVALLFFGLAFLVIRREYPRVLVLPLALVGLVALAAPVTKPGSGRPVLVFRGADPSRIHVERLRMFGSSSLKLANGTTVELEGPGRTLVVNESPIPLLIDRYSYGTGVRTSPEPTVIAPYTVESINAIIRYVGPDNPPPRESSAGEEVWLHW